MKKQLFLQLITLSCFIISAANPASGGGPIVNDSDISPRNVALYEHNLRFLSTVLTPSRVDILSQTGNQIFVYRIVHGNPVPVQGLIFKTTSAVAECLSTAALSNPRFNIAAQNYDYQISFPAPCGKTVALTFNEDSPGAQALGIWDVATRAVQKLSANVDLTFWKRQIHFSWPDQGDYYDGSAVHITDGRHWDVVGHEMGHAIYDQARLGVFGGGEHKIDQCYSDALALSEGWASYFSAWLSLNPSDPDAKFEYMVPRRAPIQVENIPADVCKGPTSEWRVFGFFWDLNDLHNDGETSTETFAQTWNAMLGKDVSNMVQAVKVLEAGGVNPDLLRTVWQLDFQMNSPF